VSHIPPESPRALARFAHSYIDSSLCQHCTGTVRYGIKTVLKVADENSENGSDVLQLPLEIEDDENTKGLNINFNVAVQWLSLSGLPGETAHK
jgi:hypothetical protein